MVEKKISFGLLYAMQAGQKWMAEHMDQFTDPVLILHGLNDGLVDVKSSSEVLAEIKSVDKSLFVYAGLYHEILNEPCKDKILGHITEWLDERV